MRGCLPEPNRNRGLDSPRACQDRFPAGGSHLQRYAAVFLAGEINSSFYRNHRHATYQRWASSVPEHVRFAVKIPRAITHDQQLVAADVLLDVFLAAASGLGHRLGVLLVQLPPSLALQIDHAENFLGTLRERFRGHVACEPQHLGWFEADANVLLQRHRVARVGADLARVPPAAIPGGLIGLLYYRIHGSPRMYYSSYSSSMLEHVATALAPAAHTSERWCIFDNTRLGAATGDALALLWLVTVACAKREGHRV